MAGTTFPRLLPLETVRRPGEALALVYPLAAGRKRCAWTEINRKIKQVNADSGVLTLCALKSCVKIILSSVLFQTTLLF